MERVQAARSLPFEIGALYNRRDDIHGRFGGQRQGGISTPVDAPFVFLFTGEAGKQHGYSDWWDDDGQFHYYGEGQVGDMADKGGNRALRQHVANGKRLLLFQALGKGRPYRFLGEFQILTGYEKAGVLDSADNLRTALVFKLTPVEQEFDPFENRIAYSSSPQSPLALAATTTTQLVTVRSKQSLFRRRLLTVERSCRITGVEDLRFLRASHIQPWAKCHTGDQRVDGSNGLLLTSQADFLFDRGWITFEDSGALVRSNHLPQHVLSKIGLRLREGRKCGSFSTSQAKYLEFHRNSVFDKAFTHVEDPLLELLSTTAP
jgi:5-methylcytosine-specific restriction protein A